MFHQVVAAVMVGLAFISAPHAQGLYPERYGLLSDGYGPVGMEFMSPGSSDIVSGTAVVGQSADIPQVVKTGKGLAATGMLLWTTGKILEIIGIVQLINGDGSSDGLGLLIPGLVLDLFGPIPSCVGEAKVKKAVGQNDDRGLDSHFNKGGKVYGISLIFLGIGVAVNMIPGAGPIISSITGGIGEVMRGVSAIGPLSRINRYKATKLSLIPYYSPDGRYGIVANAAF